MTKCYDCGKAFNLEPNEVFELIGWGDFIIEESMNDHILVNLFSYRSVVLEEEYV